MNTCSLFTAQVHAQLERIDGAVGAKAVDYKIGGDPRSALTAADLAAQAAIVAALEAAWPGLRIVGEEELVCDFVCDEEVCGKKKRAVGSQLVCRLTIGFDTAQSELSEVEISMRLEIGRTCRE